MDVLLDWRPSQLCALLWERRNAQVPERWTYRGALPSRLVLRFSLNSLSHKPKLPYQVPKARYLSDSKEHPGHSVLFGNQNVLRKAKFRLPKRNRNGRAAYTLPSYLRSAESEKASTRQLLQPCKVLHAGLWNLLGNLTKEHLLPLKKMSFYHDIFNW